MKVLEQFTDKASKEQRYQRLYAEKPFLEAYATHTDIRVSENPKGAIGREDEWETHGKMQLEFLRSRGLKPGHRLLDLGCGTGRAARVLVPFLDHGRYVGADISPAALAHAEALSRSEGWVGKSPTFFLSDGHTLPDGPFDFVWAHSVFTHLPSEGIRETVGMIRDRLRIGGQFLFTYKPADEPQRSGLKQFQYPIGFFKQVAKECGMRAERLPKVFPASQLTARLLWGKTAVIR